MVGRWWALKCWRLGAVHAARKSMRSEAEREREREREIRGKRKKIPFSTHPPFGSRENFLECSEFFASLCESGGSSPATMGGWICHQLGSQRTFRPPVIRQSERPYIHVGVRKHLEPSPGASSRWVELWDETSFRFLVMFTKHTEQPVVSDLNT